MRDGKFNNRAVEDNRVEKVHVFCKNRNSAFLSTTAMFVVSLIIDLFFDCCIVWTRQKSSNSVTILRNVNVPKQFLFGNWIFLLQLREKFEVPAKSYNISSRIKDGRFEKKIMFFKVKDMLRNAKNKMDGNHPTIISRYGKQMKNTENRWDLSVSERKK